MLSKLRNSLRIITRMSYIFGVSLVIVATLLSFINFPVSAEWNKGSLSFRGSCGGNCTVVKALICNDGSGDMDQPTAFEVYYSASGDPKSGTIVSGGTVPALPSGQCASLEFHPNGVAGNYIFKAYQPAEHPGQGVLWSGSCSIGPCQVPTFTPVTPTNTPVTPTFTPVTPTPQDPTPTPVTPTSTVFTPTNTPVTPTQHPTPTPVTPTNTPETPTSTPVTPTPQDPTPTPVTPTNTPVTPSSTPVTATPQEPTPTPVTPTPGESTPTPVGTTPSSENTPVATTQVPTLPPPVVQDTPGVLIPVTGGDFSMINQTGGAVQKVSFNFGLGLIGFGMVLQGIRKKFNL